MGERLDELDRLTSHLNGDEVERLRSCLVGSACARLSPLEWDSALGIAIERFNVWSHAEAQKTKQANEAPSVL